ncbi:MAG: prepilin-type N-terminal cleavage/methylation domain-containing protein [Hydrogenibacillus schlegelii]|uniref:Prepilin-type N-terminal cleavage/methylation domain-containing protein n=1 Tax=Hydrogenibacillus schlegelii TaxID=1484 RepID=A0A947CUN8_HYDSH|nr:prepilin-type N-terminal cleavage/methylation domain-containing protein [Hydrogenibacillus schlegelii]
MKRPPDRPAGGFTLVELLAVLALSGLVLLFLSLAAFGALKNAVAVREASRIEDEARAIFRAVDEVWKNAGAFEPDALSIDGSTGIAAGVKAPIRLPQQKGETATGVVRFEENRLTVRIEQGGQTLQNYAVSLERCRPYPESAFRFAWTGDSPPKRFEALELVLTCADRDGRTVTFTRRFRTTGGGGP